MLILTEKPSVAKDFAAALGASGNKGYYASGDLIITYCVGHLFELYNPEDYDPKYKKWDFQNLPVIPQEFLYQMNIATKNQAGIVIDLLKKHKNDEIIIATDAGREGELIARIALREAGISDISRFKRFWVSEALTKDVILSGIKNALPLSEYNTLSEQGFARQQADWLVGINFTRLMSIGNPPPPFSVGRVQTALLSSISDRNNEIVNFVPDLYKELAASIQSKDGITINALLENPKTGKTAFFSSDFEYCTAASDKCKYKPIDSVEVSSQEKKKKPEKLFNITGLQKAAFKKFGYKPEETLNIAQALYETHKCLSYPRTPSRVMGDNNVELFMEKFELLKDESPLSTFCDVSLISSSNEHIFNSVQLEDHHALIPLARLPDNVSEKEFNVFFLVLNSFFTVCMPDYVYNEKSLRFHVLEYFFTSTVHEVIQPGWKVAKNNDSDTEENIDEVPQFNEMGCFITDLSINDKKTTPKKEYALDTLLSFIEHPKGDSETRLAGLGTPATRAEIIKTLFNREYIVENKKKLFVTERGKFLLHHMLHNEHLKKLCDVSNTTVWEQKLNDNPVSFLKEISVFIAESIQSFSASSPASFQKKPLGKCPLCGKPVFESNKGYSCSGYKDDPKCSFVIWKSISGASVSANDCSLLLMGQKTSVKKCKSKDGKPFEASFALEGGKVVFKFKPNK